MQVSQPEAEETNSQDVEGRSNKTPHAVPLVVQTVLLGDRHAAVLLLDEAQAGVDVERLEQLLAVDVPAVEGVGWHLALHVPGPGKRLQILMRPESHVCLVSGVWGVVSG